MNAQSVNQLIQMALAEDIGPGDVTTDHLITPERMGRANILAKQDLVIAGLQVAEKVFRVLDDTIVFKTSFEDGEQVGRGMNIATLDGSLRALLIGERAALNFLQRLSGIATHVRDYMTQLEGAEVRLVDTRKTTPGWRVLEKYAVRMGGASNHRMGLFDGILIKDNHIVAAGGIREAVASIRTRISHLIKIEVEVSNAAEVEEALEAGVDVIMLDNMSPTQIESAVKQIDGRALVEVSGGVTRKDLLRLAGTGVDIISSGALTHSAVAVDISMKIE